MKLTIGIICGFLGAGAALMALPNLPLPCKMIVSREVVRYDAKTHMQKISNQTVDYSGAGTVSGGSVVCRITLPTIGSL